MHRDLKPANIKVREDGTVKVLDFGLAKALENEPASNAGLSMSPTITTPAATRMGMILGTAAYMSPEQARGKVVDKRTDIWAFGCVLYEMCTGKPAFVGETVTDVISAVVTRDPEWDAIPDSVRRVLRRCLAKDSRERWRDIGDVRFELQAGFAADGRSDGFLPTPPWWRRPILAVALAALVCLGVGFAFGRARPGNIAPAAAAGTSVTRTVIELPATKSLTVGTLVPLIGFESPSLAISPDGEQLVYVGRTEGGTQLYHRPMNSFAEPTALPGTEGALFAFFSPDGTEIGFLTSDRVKKTSVNGGMPTTLSPARTPGRANWVAGGLIYFSEDEGRTLSRVLATGGEPTQVVTRSTDGWRVTDVLPDGRAALAIEWSSGSMSTDYASIQLLMLDTLAVTPLLSSAYDARYLASGHIQFARAGALVAVPFDLDRLVVTGEPVVVARDVGMESLFGTVHAVSSENGTLVYVAGGDFARGKLAYINRQGDSEFLGAPERVYGVFDVDPDGRRIAAAVADVKDYVWIWNDGDQVGQVLVSSGNQPRWDVRGERVAFVVGAPGDKASRLMTQDVRGGSPQQLLSPGAALTSWASNGLVSLDSWLEDGVGFMSPDAGKQPTWVNARAWASGLSPDGRFLSFATDESGRYEVWVRQVGGEFGRQISTDGGVETVWCTECGELFYRNGNRIFASRYTLQPAIQFGPPRPVFEAVEFIDTPGKSFDILPMDSACITCDGPHHRTARRFMSSITGSLS